jgi:hypothetical protein
MRILFLLLMSFCLLSNVSAIASTQRDTQEQPLMLTTKIISQTYCAASEKVAVLQIRLRLRYTNVGNRKLILYRGHDLFYQAKIRRAANDTRARPYEITILNARYFDEQPEEIERPTPGNVFVILSPRGVYETETTIGMAVVGQEADRSNDRIVVGDHSLQIIVSTWYKSKILAEKLRRQWRGKGLLWFDSIGSTPIHFMVEEQRLLTHCP